jgi:hypothetical protein
VPAFANSVTTAWWLRGPDPKRPESASKRTTGCDEGAAAPSGQLTGVGADVVLVSAIWSGRGRRPAPQTPAVTLFFAMGESTGRRSLDHGVPALACPPGFEHAAQQIVFQEKIDAIETQLSGYVA